MNDERRAHCWEEGPRTADGVSTTCMKWDGHEGEHEFVRDDEILVRFKDEKEE
jgi:hypothetical protein